jgi:hypothetical protein
MEDQLNIRSDNWADIVRELNVADGSAGRDEDSIVGKPLSVFSSTRGYGGDILSRIVVERYGASATLVTVMGK